jgi:hypothetical protein
MPAIPFLLIGQSQDKQHYVLVHHLPDKEMPVSVSIGEIERLPRSDFEGRCRELIIGSLDAYATRSKTEMSAYDRFSDRELKVFYRAHRFVDATLRGTAVEFAPNHLEKGDLVGCEPNLYLRVERTEDNGAFFKALGVAFERC